MQGTIQVYAPATVANVACGFDILGFALESPGDLIAMAKNEVQTLRIFNETPYQEIPLDPRRNTLGVALQAFLSHLGSNQGFDLTIREKIKPGSGIGSSAASSAAAVFGANHLLGNPCSRQELVKFAMQGEQAACGSAHADNVGPALLGGFVLIRSYHPLDVISLPHPQGLYCTIIHPQIELKTEDARRVLRKEISLKDATTQWGNVAGLVTGLFTNDFALIGRSLHDVIIEPVRSMLIPGYQQVKQAALNAGALGCSISGSGPSIFSLSQYSKTAAAVAQAMQEAFSRYDIDTETYVSPINTQGTKILT
jgi:homoserine kinase